MSNHIHRPSKRTPEENAKMRADREWYQREKPSPEQLLAAGGHTDFVTLGEYFSLRQLRLALKQEREKLGMTLAVLSERTGIDQAALSRLETGHNDNPTVGTLIRIAPAMGKEIV